MRIIALVAGALFLLSACGGTPTPAPDLVATQIAVEKAAHATMTAEAPTATHTATDTPVPTQSPTPPPAFTATRTPEPTPTSTPWPTYTPQPTYTSQPTYTPFPTNTPSPTVTPPPPTIPKPAKKPKPTSTQPPGNLLLFVSNELSYDDLYTIDSQGKNRTRLTTIGKIGRAQYSPDGRQIVFQRQETEKPHYSRDIYVMNADGSGLRNITNTTDWTEFEPDWSPDGTRIVFRGRPNADQYSKVYLMNTDGSGRTLLTDINKSNQDPTWSPDGQQLAFVSYTKGGGNRWGDQADIYLINADGSNLRNLTNRGELLTNPAWSPDGRELLFGRLATDRSAGEYWQVWRMNADGGSQRCIIGCAGSFSKNSSVPAAWRGSRIAFSSWRNGNWDVFLANPDGSNIVQLTDRDADEKTRDSQP